MKDMENFKFTIKNRTPRENRVHRALFEDDEYRPRRENKKNEYKRRPKYGKRELAEMYDNA
jgi:hypothetical protein